MTVAQIYQTFVNELSVIFQAYRNSRLYCFQIRNNISNQVLGADQIPIQRILLSKGQFLQELLDTQGWLLVIH